MGRIEELEKGLEQIKSQLIDGGMSEDSVLIITIENLINK